MIYQFAIAFTIVAIPALVGSHINRTWFMGLTILYVIVWFLLVETVRGNEGFDGVMTILLLFIAGMGLAVAGGVHVLRFVTRNSGMSRWAITGAAVVGAAGFAVLFARMTEF